MCEPELRIESLVGSCHQELGRRQSASVHVAEELPEMQLGARGADLARRRPRQRDLAPPDECHCRSLRFSRTACQQYHAATVR